jgi:hypothetical protein
LTAIPLSRPPVDDEILSLPMSASHTEAKIDQVAAAVRAFFGR